MTKVMSGNLLFIADMQAGAVPIVLAEGDENHIQTGVMKLNANHPAVMG